MHPGLDLGRQAAAGQLLQHLQHVLFAHAALCGIVDIGMAALVERAHHGIERGLSFLAQRQVQAQTDQGALGVVADGGIGGIGIGPVVLGPGLEARLRHGLLQPPRRAAYLLDRPGQQAQVIRHVDAAGAQQQQVVVIAGKALEEPEQAGVVFAAVIVRREAGRAQPLHVPGVEVFVADQAEQRDVVLAGFRAVAWQVLAAGDQRGAVEVLQAAVAVIHGIEHEHIARERQLALGLVAVPEAHLGVADALRVGQQACAVKAGRRRGHDETVRYAMQFEVGLPEIAQLERAVGQRVVIGCQIAAKAACIDLFRIQPGSQPPGRIGREHRDRMRQTGAAHGLQAQAGRVEEAAVGIKPGGAHRVVVRVDLVADRQRLAIAALHHPAVLVQLHHAAGLAVLGGAQLLQVTGKFADQVAAGNPDRQHQLLLCGGLLHRHLHLEQVLLRHGCRDLVADGHSRGNRGRRCSCSGRNRGFFLGHATSIAQQGTARVGAGGRPYMEPAAPARQLSTAITVA